ncbi:MAG TPA: hypothetical protein VK618_02675, partial [Flavitalea sp.]|nr:hypothetical protein [Flavitalea sp.]
GRLREGWVDLLPGIGDFSYFANTYFTMMAVLLLSGNTKLAYENDKVDFSCIAVDDNNYRLFAGQPSIQKWKSFF